MRRRQRRNRRWWLAAVVALACVVALAGSGCWRTGASGMPVILIAVDTLRADHLGVYGYSRPTSPSLDQWAKQAAVFDRAFSTAPWTLPSFASMFTGQLPSRHLAGMVLGGAEKSAGEAVGGHAVFGKAYARIDPDLPTLAEVLRDHGYATAAVVNNPFLHPAFGLARGFQSYDYVPGNNVTIRRAAAVVDRALAYVKAHAGRPFFLFVHFIDPHMSYDAPPPMRGRFTRDIKSRFSLPVADLMRIRAEAATLSQTDRAFIAAAYDEEVAYVDEQIGRFLGALDASGLGKKALVVVTADHGEELFDHGGFEHGHTMYDELLHVPLLVHGPGVRPGRLATAVSLVDVMPTILDAAAVPVPPGLFGVSLWPALTEAASVPSRPLFAERTLYGDQREAMIRWPLKLMIDSATGQAQLFDLAADPGEHTDRVTTDAAAVNDMRQQLGATLAAAQRSAAAPAAAPIDAATREQLRALGYGH